jgi:hypothetical protein
MNEGDNYFMDDEDKIDKSVKLANLLKIELTDEELAKSNSSQGEDINYKPINVGLVEGLLIIKKTAVGTLSEGVSYYIIPRDDYSKRWDEILVRKKTNLWEDDPQLHPMVEKIVRIKGDIIETSKTITVDCIEIVEIKDESN